MRSCHSGKTWTFVSPCVCMCVVCVSGALPHPLCYAFLCCFPVVSMSVHCGAICVSSLLLPLWFGRVWNTQKKSCQQQAYFKIQAKFFLLFFDALKKQNKCCAFIRWCDSSEQGHKSNICNWGTRPPGKSKLKTKPAVLLRDNFHNS